MFIVDRIEDGVAVVEASSRCFFSLPAACIPHVKEGDVLRIALDSSPEPALRVAAIADGVYTIVWSGGERFSIPAAGLDLSIGMGLSLSADAAATQARKLEICALMDDLFE